MKKKTTKRNFRKLPKYALGTMKPYYDKGYQEASGIGSALFTTQPGVSLDPETLAIKQNTIPKALLTITPQTPFLTQMATSPTTAATLATAPLGTTLANTASGTMSVAPGMAAGRGLSAFNMSSQIKDYIGQSATTASKGASGGLSAAGKALGVVGSAIGAATMANLIADFDSHRTGSDMMLNVGRQQYTTDYGNSYQNYTGVNSNQELAYERANARSKQLGFGINSIGTGASLGGTIGGLPGMAIGALGGLILGGLGSLLGWGDNEEEVKREILLTNDNIAMYNRDLAAVAKSKDVAAEFNNRVGSAADGKSSYGPMKMMLKYSNGKQPVMSPYGIIEETPGSYVEGQETLHDPVTGDADVAPGKPNGDIIPASTTPYNRDNVISNKNPFADVARFNAKKIKWLNSIIANPTGSKELQEVLRNEAYKMKSIYSQLLSEIAKYNPANLQRDKYKNSKLPGYSLGTALNTAGRYLGVMSPNIWGFIQNTMDYNRASKARIHSINPYQEAPLAMRAVNDMYNIRYNDRAERNDAKRLLNFDYNRINHTPGMTAGGQEIAKRAAFNSYTDYLSLIAAKANLFNANARMLANKEAINVGLTDQARGMQGISEWYKGIQEGAGKKDFAMNTHQYNRYNTLALAGLDLYKMIEGDRADKNYKELIRMYRGDYTKDQIDFLNSLGRLKPAQIDYNIPSASQTTSHIPQRFDDLLPWQQNELYNRLLAQKIIGGLG